MGLFKNDKKEIIGSIFGEPVHKDEAKVKYDSVLDYLVGLSKSEFDKLLKVANIYRTANKEASKVMGSKDENPFTDPHNPRGIVEYDGTAPYLFDDESPTRKPTKIKVDD